MATLSVTNTFISGTLAKSSEVNQNFIDLINWSSGQIQNDNFGTMTGQITWAITTGVKAISITNSGNEGSVLITQSASLNPNKSSFRLIDNAAQTLGDADMYLNMASLSSTVPIFQADYAGDTVFKINKHRVELPIRTLAQRDSITPANGSILYVEDSPASRHRGVHIKDSEGWGFLSIPAGVTLPYAGANVPSGWLLADGTAISRTTYASLFAAIGVVWGVGDGSTTFNLPDMRRRIPMGAGGVSVSGPANTLGAVGGAETHQLISPEMPQHSHGGGDHNHGGATNNGGTHQHSYPMNSNPAFPDNQTSVTANGGSIGSGLTNNAGDHTHSISSSGTIITANGGDGAHNNVQPSAVFNYIIKY